MANKKITDYDELTAAATDDYLEIVDTSETTNKRISRENLAGWHFLTTPLTSTAWDGDNKTSLDNGIIDLSTVFGATAGIKSVLVSVQMLCNTANAYIRLGPSSSSPNTVIVRTPAANVYATTTAVVPCDANGDIYFSVSPGHTCATQIWIWGYWL